MTINGDYVKMLKRGVPSAFTVRLPRRPYIVGIDAQQKLMCPSGIKSWRRFIDAMFLSVVDRAFGMGAQIVVVSFDDYRYTPSAKHETQRRRDQSLPDFEFAKHDSLPPQIPDNFNGAMRNRQFKSKVIFMVIANLRHEFHKRILKDKAWACKSLVLKFLDVEVVGAPIDIPPAFARVALPKTTSTPGATPTSGAASSEAVSSEAAQPEAASSGTALSEPRVCKTGENDITLPAWIPPPDRGPLLIISTDGDFVPISMIQVQRTGGDIILQRLTTNVGNTEDTSTYEFVSVPALIPFVQREFLTANPVKDFATLIALTGCDFCMNLPRVGPTRLWANRHFFTDLDFRRDSHLLMAMLLVYQDLFKKHTRVSRVRVLKILGQLKQKQGGIPSEAVEDDTDMENAIVSCVYREMRQHVQNAPKLSATTKQGLWVDSRALAHCRNALWTRDYWECLHEYPDPLDEGGYKYGFVMNERGWTQWRT